MTDLGGLGQGRAATVVAADQGELKEEGAIRKLRPQRWQVLPWALPTGIALGISMWGITAASFWRDEAATLSAVRRPLPVLWRMLAHTDVVHSLYYLLLWPVARAAGLGELGVRLPSALAMSAAAGGIAVIGGRLLSSRAGFAAGLIFALLPVTSRYAQEARSYAFVLAFAVLASYLLIRVIEAAATGVHPLPWLTAYGAVLALLGWTNLISLLIIPAHALTVIWAPRSSQARSGLPGGQAVTHRRLTANWLVAAGAAGMLVVPLGLLAWSQRQGTQRFLGLTTFSTIGNMPGRLTGSWLVVPVVLVLALIGIALSGPPRAAITRLCLPWLLLPPLLLFGAGLVTPVYDPRYILFCVPAIALLAGSGLDTVAAAVSARSGPTPSRRRRPSGVIAAGIAIIAILGLPNQLACRAPDGHGDNIRLVAQILAEHEHRGDAVLYFWPWWRQISAAYPGPFTNLRDVSLAATPARDGNFTGTQLPLRQISRRLAAIRAVWLIEFQRFEPYPALAPSIWRVWRRWHANDFVLTLYVRRARMGTRLTAGSGRRQTH